MAAAIDKVVLRPRQWSQLSSNPTDYYVVNVYQLLSESLTHQLISNRRMKKIIQWLAPAEPPGWQQLIGRLPVLVIGNRHQYP